MSRDEENGPDRHESKALMDCEEVSDRKCFSHSRADL